MKVEVVEKKENPFLKRTDLILRIDHAGQATPKKEDVRKVIAEKFKSVPEKVEVVYIFSEVGLARAKVKARIWEEKIPERKVKKPEEKPKEEKPKEESKPEEVEPEKKEEIEKKTEPKAEEKKEEGEEK